MTIAKKPAAAQKAATPATKAPVKKAPAAKPVVKKAPAKKAVAKKAPAAKQAAPKTPVEAASKIVDAEDNDILLRAMKLLAGEGIALDDLLMQVFPTENEEAGMRFPLRPRIATVKKSPLSVIMLEWDIDVSADLDSPIDRDCEPYKDEKAARAYYDRQVEGARDELYEQDGDKTRHLVVLLKDTSDFKKREYTIITPNDEDFEKEVHARFKKNDINFIFSGTKPKSIEGEAVLAKTTTKKKVAKKQIAPKASSAAVRETALKKTNSNKAAVRAAKEAEAAAKMADLTARVKERRGVIAAGQAAATKAAPPAKPEVPVKKRSLPQKRVS